MQSNLQNLQEFEGGEDVNMQNAESKTEWVFLCTNQDFFKNNKGDEGCKDREFFPLTCSSFMTLSKTSGRLGQLSFTDPEVFRLKKIVVEGSSTNCE